MRHLMAPSTEIDHMKLGKTLVLPIAGLLLVGAAGAAMAASSLPAAGGSDGVILAADTATPPPTTVTAPVPKDTLLADVLDQLVTKGTIDTTQKTAILDAVQAERTTRQTLRKQEAQQLKDILADGVITQAELNTLPADSPLQKLSGLMTDGKVSVSDLRSLGFNLMRGIGPGHGPGHFNGGGAFGAPNALPAPSAATGS
jgi:polyhydroxyalkanoate synthesis regulator phasin